MTRIRSLVAPILTGLLMASAGSAAAAPQVLGVVASAEARPLVCQGAECSLYLSSFCIQQEREPPAPGTRYRPASTDGAMILVVTTARGERLRLPAARHLRFTSYGGYTAVRASLLRTALDRLGGVAAALEVGTGAALVPEPRPGDPNPLTEAEIALATSPWRAAAEAVFEAAGRSSEADGAQLLSVLINALPERGRTDAAAREGVWARAVDRRVLAGLGTTGIEKARLAYGICRGFTRGRTQQPLRRCLEAQHDAWLMDLNEDYWDRLVAW